MNTNNKQHYFWIIIMLTTFFQSMGVAKTQTEYPLLPRQVDISGNIIQLAMTENFSQDFPAEDMIESINLENPQAFSEYGSVLILQRYWDFMSHGFFSKNVGTIQMTFLLKKATLINNHSIANPLDLIKTISIDLLNTYDKSNEQKAENEKVLYSNLADDFVEFYFNNQRWIRYSTWKNNDRELTSAFAIPVTKTHYIVVAFAFAPVHKISMRNFIDDYAQAHVDKIMHTFKVKYNLANSIAGEIEKLAEYKLEDLSQKIIK